MDEEITMRRHWPGLCVLFTVSLVLAGVRPAAAQWQVESKDGKTNFKFGFLAQPQLEVLETPDTTADSKNIFFRRFASSRDILSFLIT